MPKPEEFDKKNGLETPKPGVQRVQEDTRARLFPIILPALKEQPPIALPAPIRVQLRPGVCSNIRIERRPLLFQEEIDTILPPEETDKGLRSIRIFEHTPGRS